MLFAFDLHLRYLVVRAQALDSLRTRGIITLHRDLLLELPMRF